MAAVAAERITLQAQLEEQQRLAALAGLRDDLAALDTAAAAADRAAAARKAADRDLAAATARLEAIARAEAQRQSWRDLRGTVQRLSEAERQLTTAAATLAATERRPHSSLPPRPVPQQRMTCPPRSRPSAWPRKRVYGALTSIRRRSAESRNAPRGGPSSARCLGSWPR